MLIHPHDCRLELRDARLRITPARLGVLDVLEHAAAPMDVSTLIAGLSRHHVDADEATVFRILHRFVKKGIVRKVQFDEGKFRYEHAGLPKHHHFICERCGRVTDVASCPVDVMESALEKAEGVTILRHSLEFFGICGRCQS